MGNNSSVCEFNRGSDSDFYREKKLQRPPCPYTRPRRSSSVRRSASMMKKQKPRHLRRNFYHNKKVARLEQLETELRAAEEKEKLLAAAGRGDVDAVEVLLDGGLDVNVADENQMTALHHAAMHARDKVITVLIDRGADVNATDLKGGFTPLHWAVINADPQTGSTDHVDESVVALSRGGCEITPTDFNFATPLHYAAQKDNKVLIDTLIRLGADPELVDILGQNCIKVAKSEETKQLILNLHRKKKDVIYHVLEISPSPDFESPPPTPPPRHIYHELELSPFDDSESSPPIPPPRIRRSRNL